MKDISDVTAIVVDHGIFLPIALRLARDFKKVFYFSPHESAFPRVRDVVGDGFPEIQRVRSIWEVIQECDMACFPDIGFRDEQEELIRQGFPVWGPRSGYKLEESRFQFIRALGSTNLEMPPHTIVTGMEALREHLRNQEDKYVKVSKFRGDWETLHWRDWGQDEMELDARSVKLGPWKDVISFYVFDKIDTQIEDGCDTFCIDGQFPSIVIHGQEAKDKAYLGTFQKADELPEQLRQVNAEFGPILAGYEYRSFFSSEVRITEDDNKGYFIDPTMRAGSPPSQVMCEMIGNLGEIIWSGANGILVEPQPASKFGVQAMLAFCSDRNSWRTFDVPSELERWVKCGFCSKINGRLCFPPDETMMHGEFGWLVGIGDTAEEAIEHLKDNASKLPDGVHCEFSSIADLINEVKSANETVSTFTEEPMPDPSIVLEKETS